MAKKVLGHTTQHNWQIKLFFTAFLFLILIFRPPIENMRQGFALTFQIGSALILAAFITFYINTWAGIFLGWIVIGTCLSSLLYSDFKILYSSQSIEAIRAVTSGFVIYIVIVLVRPDEKWILNMLCVALILHLFCQLAQFVNNSASVGIMYNPNGAGTFAALCSVAFYRPGWCYLFFIPLTSVIYAKSFGGAVGLGCAVVGFGFTQSWRVGFLAILIMTEMACLYALIVDIPSFNRLGAWKFAMVFSFENLWPIGVGTGEWKAYFNKIYDLGYLGGTGRRTWIRLHNTWIEGFVEMGLPFMALCIAFVIDNVRRFTQKATIPMLGLAVIFGVGMSNSFFKFNPLNGLVAIILLSLLTIHTRENGRRSSGNT